MITRLGMAPRAAGLTPVAFQEHWASDHAGVAAELPGLRAYVQHRAVLRGGEPLLAELEHDALSEIDFDDVAAMDAAFASETYRTAVRADEARFIDKGRFEYGVYDRTVLRDGSAPVELLLLWPDAPGAVEHDGRHERLEARPERPAPFARVDVLGHADTGAALLAAAAHPDATRLISRAVDIRARVT